MNVAIFFSNFIYIGLQSIDTYLNSLTKKKENKNKNRTEQNKTEIILLISVLT